MFESYKEFMAREGRRDNVEKYGYLWGNFFTDRWKIIPVIVILVTLIIVAIYAIWRVKASTATVKNSTLCQEYRRWKDSKQGRYEKENGICFRISGKSVVVVPCTKGVHDAIFFQNVTEEQICP